MKPLFLITCSLLFSLKLSAETFLEEKLVYNTTNICIQKIVISGNKVTKAHIILRELTFQEGDTVKAEELAALMERSENNLFNTSLFNFIYIDSLLLPNQCLQINIEVRERWYTWPVPIFDIHERNFNAWLENKNLARVSYGFYLVRHNFRGRKENLTLKFRLGYSELFGISYEKPYLDKKQNHGLGFSLGYNRRHEIPYRTINNELQFFKYPDEYIRTERFATSSYTYRQGLYNVTKVDLNFTSVQVTDTVMAVANDYLEGNDAMDFFRIDYSFRHDMRDSKIYPLKGYYFGFIATKLGLGILPEEKVDLFYLTGIYKKYWTLKERFFAGTAVRAKISNRHSQPYFLQRGLGYDNFVRGYEYYVVDGQNYGLVKTAFRYQLVKPKTITVNNLPVEQFNKFHYAFYLGIFADMGYVEDRAYQARNFLGNEMLFGSGLGLDFVTYYDNVFRFEYSINKMKEHGFFIHFISAI